MADISNLGSARRTTYTESEGELSEEKSAKGDNWNDVRQVGTHSRILHLVQQKPPLHSPAYPPRCADVTMVKLCAFQPAPLYGRRGASGKPLLQQSEAETRNYSFSF